MSDESTVIEPVGIETYASKMNIYFHVYCNRTSWNWNGCYASAELDAVLL